MGPEKTQDKREMIIQAAGRVLADKGYAQTTVSQVAAAAGVSRGLLHYYFKNKEELLTRVIEANVIFSLGLIEAVFTASDSAAALAQNMVAALRGVTLHQPYFFALFQEFLALARAKPAIAEKLAEFYRLFRQRLSEELTGAARRGVVAAGEDHEPRAAMLTALIDGLGLQLASDPDLARRDELWTEAVRVIRAVIDGR